jgi:hypothetical protein
MCLCYILQQVLQCRAFLGEWANQRGRRRQRTGPDRRPGQLSWNGGGYILWWKLGRGERLAPWLLLAGAA